MLENHAPIVAILQAGKITAIDPNDEIHEFIIQGGFCEQHDNRIILCVEEFGIKN